MDPNVSNGQPAPRLGEAVAIVATHRYLAAPYLARIERIRESHADADLHRLLARRDTAPTPVGLLVSRLRIVAGTALVRAGARLMGVPGRGAEPTDHAGGPCGPSALDVGSRHLGRGFPAGHPGT